MLWLPAAVRENRTRANPWSQTTDPKGCLHTTETSVWPSYNGWTVMPHVTVMPLPGRGVDVRQHLPFNQGAFALRNESGGVQTNRDYVFQIELIGTSERGGPGLFWPEADAEVLRDLYVKVIEPLSTAFDIPLRAQPFQAYPQSYGPRGRTNTVRLAGSTFDTWSGWLGHQHVPENTHGDPGAFPWARMMLLVEELDMALSAEDKKWLETLVKRESRAQAEAAIKDVLATEKMVRNQPLDAGDVEADPWTFAGALSNVEKDLDLQGRTLKAILDAVTSKEGN